VDCRNAPGQGQRGRASLNPEVRRELVVGSEPVRSESEGQEACSRESLIRQMFESSHPRGLFSCGAATGTARSAKNRDNPRNFLQQCPEQRLQNWHRGQLAAPQGSEKTMEIRFISSLTAEDEELFAPAVLKAASALLDQLPLAYTIRIETTGAQVYQHTHVGPDVRETGLDPASGFQPSTARLLRRSAP